jgi:chaperone BCS1
MIEALFTLLKANPLLLAGIGTVLSGSVMYFVRGIPRWIYGAIRRFATVEVSLTSESFLYHELLGLLSAHRIRALSRSFTTDHDGNIVAGYGHSVSRFDRHFISFKRELIKENRHVSEKLDATIFARNPDVLRRLVERARAPRVEDMVKVYSGSYGCWNSPVRKRKRALDTIFVNGSVKDEIIEKIEWFLANEDWYIRRGIPYKLVFLLHGPPGTGKSSLVYGIASYFGRSVGMISEVSSFEHALRNLPENSFAVVEDIDLITLKRPENGAPASGHADETMPTTAAASAPAPSLAADMQRSALQVVINTLDGLYTPAGLILFMTTN